MKARLKRGKVIEGRLAEIFVSRKLAKPLRQNKPKGEDVKEDSVVKETEADNEKHEAKEVAKTTKKQKK